MDTQIQKILQRILTQTSIQSIHHPLKIKGGWMDMMRRRYLT